jgi:hypothetical protein
MAAATCAWFTFVASDRTRRSERVESRCEERRNGNSGTNIAIDRRVKCNHYESEIRRRTRGETTGS